MGLFQLSPKLTIQFVVKLSCVRVIRDGVGVIRFPSRLHLFHWKQYWCIFPSRLLLLRQGLSLCGVCPVEASLALLKTGFV